MALISKKIVRKIESELYDYPQKIKSINEQRDDIFNGSHYPEVTVSGGEMGNTTQSKGIRLAQIEAGWPELIKEALTTIPMEYSLLIKYKYFEHKPNDIVAEKLLVGRTLFYAWQENAILCLAMLAMQKGLIKQNYPETR